MKEINVDIKIIGFVAEVTSSLQYTNSEDKPIEAEFTFPVDDGSAVFKFEAEIEGRHIVAEIQEKEQVSSLSIDDGSAVIKFEAEIEGRHIVAEIQEKEQVGHILSHWCVLYVL